MAKKKLVDRKPVIFKSTKNTPSINTIKKAYGLIPDNKKIPVVFQTKKQYLKEYVTNQEKKKNTKFTDKQKKAYESNELRDMKNIVSRYTTNKNPYIDRRVVFFTDKKMPKEQFVKNVLHEYGHELWENNQEIRRDWSTLNKRSSPTPYGKTHSEEDFAESYALKRVGALICPDRKQILRKHGVRKHPSLKPSPSDLSMFDVNKDGVINDLDMEIIRKNKSVITKDKNHRNNVAEGLGLSAPEEYLDTPEWKIYGVAKEYDPRHYSPDLTTNISELLRRRIKADDESKDKKLGDAFRSAKQQLSEEVDRGARTIGKYYVDKERIAEQRMMMAEEQQRRNEALRTLITLRSAGLLSSPARKALTNIQAHRVLSGEETYENNPYPIRVRQPRVKLAKKTPYVLQRLEE